MNLEFDGITAGIMDACPEFVAQTIDAEAGGYFSDNGRVVEIWREGARGRNVMVALTCNVEEFGGYTLGAYLREGDSIEGLIDERLIDVDDPAASSASRLALCALDYLADTESSAL